MPSLASSQNLVSGRPLTSSMTKNGRRSARQAAVEHPGDVGMVHDGQGLPLLLEALEHGLGVHAGLDQLERDLALDRLGLLGDPDLAHAAFADLLDERVSAGDDHRRADSGSIVGGRVDGGAASSGSGVWSRVAHGWAAPGAESDGLAGSAAGLSSMLPDFSWAARSASTAARSSGRPRTPAPGRRRAPREIGTTLPGTGFLRSWPLSSDQGSTATLSSMRRNAVASIRDFSVSLVRRPAPSISRRSQARA